MRPYEETRLTGVATRIDAIVQGDFMNEWVRMNEKRASDFTAAHARFDTVLIFMKRCLDL